MVKVITKRPLFFVKIHQKSAKSQIWGTYSATVEFFQSSQKGRKQEKAKNRDRNALIVSGQAQKVSEALFF